MTRRFMIITLFESGAFSVYAMSGFIRYYFAGVWCFLCVHFIQFYQILLCWSLVLPLCTFYPVLSDITLMESGAPSVYALSRFSVSRSFDIGCHCCIICNFYALSSFSKNS